MQTPSILPQQIPPFLQEHCICRGQILLEQTYRGDILGVQRGTTLMSVMQLSKSTVLTVRDMLAFSIYDFR